jgi:hypothetical protein
MASTGRWNAASARLWEDKRGSHQGEPFQNNTLFALESWSIIPMEGHGREGAWADRHRGKSPIKKGIIWRVEMEFIF